MTKNWLVFTHNFEKWVESYQKARSIYNSYKRLYGSARLYEFLYKNNEPINAWCLKACGELPN